jgi:hypothetical protein
MMMLLIVQLWDVLIILQIFMDHQQKNQKEMDKDMDSNDWLEKGEDEKGDRFRIYLGYTPMER